MKQKSTVFVVDDDSGFRESLRWLVESAGFHVKAFSAAEEFLERYDPSRPGCLVLDVRMPGMNGLELQERLARRKARIPIIMVTGWAEPPAAKRAMDNGAVDFLTKPFSDEVLLDRIRRALEVDRERRGAAPTRTSRSRSKPERPAKPRRSPARSPRS